MDPAGLKKELLEQYIGLLSDQAQNARLAMEDHQTQANDYGAPKDRYDSFRTKLLRMRDMFAAQYQKTLDEIHIVEKINPQQIMNKPGLGAVLHLSNGKFFVAPGGGKLKTAQGEFHILTPQSPLFQEIRNHHKGEKFRFNGRELEFIDCY